MHSPKRKAINPALGPFYQKSARCRYVGKTGCPVRFTGQFTGLVGMCRIRISGRNSAADRFQGPSGRLQSFVAGRPHLPRQRARAAEDRHPHFAARRKNRRGQMGCGWVGAVARWTPGVRLCGERLETAHSERGLRAAAPTKNKLSGHARADA